MKLNLKKGESRVLSFDANPSTGYSWEYIPKNPNFVNITNLGFISQKEGTGTSGKINFEFKANRLGTENIIFVYKRQWEKESEAKLINTIKIIVE